MHKNISINIPKNTKIIKIGSYNINLNDSINRSEHIKNIVNYVFSEISSITLDVICLQGMRDRKLMRTIMKEIYKVSQKNKKPVDIIPKLNFKNIGSCDSNTYKMLMSYDETDYSDNTNMIISRYPIISSSYKILHSNKTLLIANISIDDYIISIYNTELTCDYLGISNSLIRKKEIEDIKSEMNINLINLEKINNSLNQYQNKYIIKNINFLCGILNINEIINDNINPELLHFLSILNAVDIFRIMEENIEILDLYNNNSKNTRDCYILAIIDSIDIIQTNKYLINKLSKNHNTNIIAYYIVETFKSNDYYPIEIILLLNQQDKIKIKE
jgi:hypothetical protein